MSTDPIGAALTLDRPAVRASAPRAASEQSSELAGIATAIERVEALLASVGPEPEGSDAIERIADIAFVLHERDVEASLCDALDAAVRELGNANETKQTNVQHVRQAAEVLRELSQRIGNMIALLQVSPPSDVNAPTANDVTPEQGEPALAEQPASADALGGDIPREGLFTAEILENDEFARVVADLAASLPALAVPVEAISVALHESADPTTEELALAPESEAVTGAHDETDDPASSESPAAPEPAEAPFETHSQPDQPVIEQPMLPARPGEAAANALAEARHDLAELPSDKASFERQPSALCDPPVIAQALQKLVGGPVGPAQPANLPGDLPDHSLLNGHVVRPPADADTSYIPSEALSSAPPEPVPDGEATLPPDNSTGLALSAQSERPPNVDMPAPLADADIPARQPSDQNTHCIGGDEPAQIASDALAHDADETVPETAARPGEEPPRRFVDSSQSLLPELALVDPQDDPGDLFEPPTGAAATTFTGSQSAGEIAARAAAMRAHSPAAVADPLAAMRTLGAEELLALFT